MMSVAVHANSDCLTAQSSQPDTPTAGYDVDEYSDRGCPTLPRPKVIVAVSRSGSPWNAHEASLLQTVPVRLSPQINTRAMTASPVSTSRVVDSVKGKTTNFTGKESESCLVNKDKVFCNSEQRSTESVNLPGNRSETRSIGTRRITRVLAARALHHRRLRCLYLSQKRRKPDFRKEHCPFRLATRSVARSISSEQLAEVAEMIRFWA